MVTIPDVPLNCPTDAGAQVRILFWIAQQLHAIAMILQAKVK